MKRSDLYGAALCGLLSLSLLVGCQSSAVRTDAGQEPEAVLAAAREPEAELTPGGDGDRFAAVAAETQPSPAAADQVDALFAALEAGEVPVQRTETERDVTQAFLTREELNQFTRWLWVQSEAGALEEGVSLTDAICIEGGRRNDGTIWLTAWEGAASFYFADLRETETGYELLALEGWGC